jgi:hypothetical protein
MMHTRKYTVHAETMRFRTWFLACVIFIGSCSKVEPPQSRKRVGIGSFNAFVQNVTFQSYAANALYIQMDVGAVGTGNNTDLKWVPDSAFKNMVIGNNNIIIEKVERIQQSENKTYTNALVIDQSDYFNDADVMNLRTRALNKTLIETLEDPANKIALGAFDRDIGFPLHVWFGSTRDAFNQTYEESGKILMQYYFYEGASSNLLDALYGYLEKLDKNNQNTEKYLTAIVRSTPDNSNKATATQIITRAKQMGIKINLIFLEGNYSLNLATIALRTNGFVNIISSTDMAQLTNGDIMDKGTPMLGSIHRILARNNYIYRLHLKIVRSTGNWYAGAIAFDPFQINYMDDEGNPLINNILPYYVQLP